MDKCKCGEVMIAASADFYYEYSSEVVGYKTHSREKCSSIPVTMTTDPRCKCSLPVSTLGDGCRYCQPQTYIDYLEREVEEQSDRSDQIEHAPTCKCEECISWQSQ